METVKAPGRIAAQDIAKGLGILLVVAFHTCAIPGAVYLYIFALFCYIMPFFFFISGYNYKPGKRSCADNIKRRCKQLLQPFFKYSLGIFVLFAVFLLLTQTASMTEVALSYPQFLLSRPGRNLLGIESSCKAFQLAYSPFWFLITLLVGYVIFFAIADYALKNSKRSFSVAAALLTVSGAYVSFLPALPWNIQTAPAAAALILLGAWFGQHKLLAPESVSLPWTVLNSVISCCITVLLCFFFKTNGLLEGGVLKEGWHVLLSAAYAVFGSYALVNLCKLLEHVKYISGALIWCGKNTLPILLLHMPLQYIFGYLLGISNFNFMSIDPSAAYDVRYLLVMLLTMLVIIVHILGTGYIRKKDLLRKKSQHRIDA